MPESNIHTAIYPLSADPPTLAHADIMCRAACRFERLYWAIGENPGKRPMFSLQTRMEMMQAYVDHFKQTNVSIVSYSGSTVRFAEKKKAGVIIKGLRNYLDFQNEFDQCQANKHLNPRIETFLLFTSPEYVSVSSSLLRELIGLGEPFDQYVVESVALIISKNKST